MSKNGFRSRNHFPRKKRNITVTSVKINEKKMVGKNDAYGALGHELK
jgi:hypothetical protein